MPRIRNDPNLNICPDYNLDDFTNTRAQPINQDTTEAQAVQLLRNIWEANNNADKCLWQQQLNDDREECDIINEEQKKNKFKYILIQNTGIPDDPVITPSSYALCKLEQGEYVEIWYFTNDGLDEAAIKKTIDDDAMVLSTLADGSTAWVSSASMWSTRSVLNDEDLPFEEFCQACPRFLTAL
ncbi:hypothetical protein F4604DRAFT_1523759, partial [Suillus subluteus]